MPRKNIAAYKEGDNMITITICFLNKQFRILIRDWIYSVILQFQFIMDMCDDLQQEIPCSIRSIVNKIREQNTLKAVVNDYD